MACAPAGTRALQSHRLTHDTSASTNKGSYHEPSQRAGHICLRRIAAHTRSASTRATTCIYVATQLRRGTRETRFARWLSDKAVDAGLALTGSAATVGAIERDAAGRGC
jgi:hypothetical protein